LDILAASGREHLVPPLLVYHDDAEVRLRTLEILGEAERQDALHLVERRLNDESADVQAEAIRVLAKLRNEDACELMLPRLADADPRVRSTAIACLLNHGLEPMKRRATATLEGMLIDASAEIRSEAAKALGTATDDRFSADLLKLLYDNEPVVVRHAIDSIRRRVVQDGPNPIYLPTLISLLQERRLKHEAREALIEFGEEAVPALIHFMNDIEESLWVRRAIPKTIARIGTPAAGVALTQCLSGQSDSFLRGKLMESLALLNLESSTRAKLVPEIETETRRFLRTLADLAGLRRNSIVDAHGPTIQWAETASPPALLEQLLAARLRDHLRNLFGLLALTHDPSHMWSAYRTISGEQANLRGHSLEYLDNTLTGEIRTHVFAAIGDLPLAQKLAEAAERYGIRVETRQQTLARLMEASLDGTSDESFVVVTAVYAVYTDRLEPLYPAIEALRESPNAFVRETADWVGHHLAWSPETPS